MNDLLNKIDATIELKEGLGDSSFKVHIDSEKSKIKMSVEINEHLSAKNNIELYSKIHEKVMLEIGFTFDGVECDLDYANELIYVYENLREFIIWKNSRINLSHIIVDINDSELIINVARNEVLPQISEHIEEISKYLNQLSICDKEIRVNIDPDLFHEQKLNKIIEDESKGDYAQYKTVEILDEKLREGFTKVDFQITSEKQTKVYFEGEVFDYEVSKTKSGAILHKFNLGHFENAIEVTSFEGDGNFQNDNGNQNKFKFKNLPFPKINNGDCIRVYGTYEFNEYSKGHVFKIFNPGYNIQKLTSSTLNKIEKEKLEYIRHEFHVHTKMSTLDGVPNVNDYVRYAEEYNIGSLTITDHNTAQAFPDAYYTSKGTDVKINYGVELDVYDDLNTEIVINNREQELIDAEYIFFDLETTSVSAWLSEIIEFGAVKYKNNTVIDRKQMFIKPTRDISDFTTSLTGIKNSDVENAPSIDEAIKEIKEWIGDSILVAHNASFDYGFLNKAFIDAGFGPLENPVVDTMKLSWFFHPASRSHRLGVLAKNEYISYDVEAAHRADYDAEVLAKIFERLLHKLLVKDVRNLIDINIEKFDKIGTSLYPLCHYYFSKHITLVSKNQEGLRDLNEIISLANIKYFNKKKKMASMPLSFFINKEERLLKNMLVGSACSNGFIFDSVLNAEWDVVRSLISMYDYIEIFPPTSYLHLINNHIIDRDELKMVLRKIKELADENNVPVIISSNAHYASPREKEYRNILISAKRVGGLGHPLHNYRNPTVEKPNNHLRTTTEIFKEFHGIFNEEQVMEMAIRNPQALNDQIHKQSPIHKDLFAPTIDGAIEELKETIDKNILDQYGENPDESIVERVHRELDPIIEHGYGIIYYLSAKAVKKSNDDGYLVGSRGSVGSSLAATFSGITEVNPLDPHYRCPKCKHHEFCHDVDDGYDLPNKNCPVCQTKMIGDGHKIPFETFLGFNAEKVPDIDLNFSRDNQSDIHLYMKEFLGEENVYRAGTISTAAPKTAMGYVRSYGELSNVKYNNATVNWLASKVEGAKRTTGQHPGGLIVIPSDKSVYEFTPINYPGDDADSDWKTTHFDFHSIHDNLLKLDLLGHLDPSTVRMLQTLTNVDPKDIPMNDKEVISLFDNNEALKYEENYTGEDLGILGIPEFGTKFVRDLVRESKPKSFADLVRISGLSHGTDVWANNAQDIIKKGVATLSEVISVRDDIMTFLIENGMDKSMSFDIMESVRKGKGLNAEWIHSMRDNRIPEWYIESCQAIKYMFPKAHATAYVMMAFRIAWYKINYPLEYYATYFSKRDVEIDLSKVLSGIDKMKEHYNEIKAIPKFEKTKKDDDLLDTYLIIFEMYSRGIKFENINIHKSRSANYVINKEDKTIIPPFSVLPGVGELVARSATINREQRAYETVEDFKSRSGLPKKVIESLEEFNVFKGEKTEQENTQQLSLFDW